MISLAETSTRRPAPPAEMRSWRSRTNASFPSRSALSRSNSIVGRRPVCVSKQSRLNDSSTSGSPGRSSIVKSLMTPVAVWTGRPRSSTAAVAVTSILASRRGESGPACWSGALQWNVAEGGVPPHVSSGGFWSRTSATTSRSGTAPSSLALSSKSCFGVGASWLVIGPNVRDSRWAVKDGAARAPAPAVTSTDSLRSRRTSGGAPGSAWSSSVESSASRGRVMPSSCRSAGRTTRISQILGRNATPSAPGIALTPASVRECISTRAPGSGALDASTASAISLPTGVSGRPATVGGPAA